MFQIFLLAIILGFFFAVQTFPTLRIISPGCGPPPTQTTLTAERITARQRCKNSAWWWWSQWRLFKRRTVSRPTESSFSFNTDCFNRSKWKKGKVLRIFMFWGRERKVFWLLTFVYLTNYLFKHCKSAWCKRNEGFDEEFVWIFEISSIQYNHAPQLQCSNVPCSKILTKSLDWIDLVIICVAMLHFSPVLMVLWRCFYNILKLLSNLL